MNEYWLERQPNFSFLDALVVMFSIDVIGLNSVFVMIAVKINHLGGDFGSDGGTMGGGTRCMGIRADE
jgi:hypothetical protein